ncbi:MAG: hypothetical protein WD627_07100 [Actinomycetota bacterium]
MSTRSRPLRDTGRRRWPIGLAAALAFLMAGSLVAALLSLRSIEGAIPGKAAILGFATDGRAFLIGTANRAYTSLDGRTWSAVEGLEGPTLLAGGESGAVLLNGGKLYRSEDLRTLTPLPGEAREAAALAAGPTGEIYLATGSGRFFRAAADGKPREIEGDRGPDEVLALAAGEGSPPPLLAGGLNSGLWRSDDGGARWSRILGTPTRAAMLDRQVAGRGFIATAGGVLVSADGRRWEFTDLRDAVEALAQTQDMYFAITAERLVYESPDGLEWKPLS